MWMPVLMPVLVTLSAPVPGKSPTCVAGDEALTEAFRPFALNLAMISSRFLRLSSMIFSGSVSSSRTTTGSSASSAVRAGADGSKMFEAPCEVRLCGRLDFGPVGTLIAWNPRGGSSARPPTC